MPRHSAAGRVWCAFVASPRTVRDMSTISRPAPGHSTLRQHLTVRALPRDAPFTDRCRHQLLTAAAAALAEHDEAVRSQPQRPPGARHSDRLWELLDFASSLGGELEAAAEEIVALLVEHDTSLRTHGSSFVPGR